MDYPELAFERGAKRSTHRPEFAALCRLNPAKTPVQRYEEVDGLRAVACGLVIWHHVAEAFAPIAGSGSWVLTLANRGNFGLAGVLAFFAISGYVIPSSLDGPRSQGVKRFGVRRFWRLYPPFWFALLLTWGLAEAVFPTERVVWNFTMLPSLGGTEPAAGHFWTLEVEMLFYAAVALLYLVVGRLGRWVVWPVFLGLGLWHVWQQNFDAQSHWRSIVFYLAVMFWGASCREILRGTPARPATDRSSSGWWRVVALGLATGLLLLRSLKSVYFGFREANTEVLTFGLGTSLGILLFFIWVVLVPVRSAWLARVGRWTYSTYLLHAVVFYSVLQAIVSGEIAWLTGWPLPLYVLAMLGICFAAGGLAYRWIEQPSDRVGKRLSASYRR
jgi:peptidoglycan/LPS O-acetylase OafA/YrhL